MHSVQLFSRRPVEELDGATVLRTASSRTSVLLLELLCRHRWEVAPRFATVRAEPADLDALARFPHEAVLVIGDAALLLAARRALSACRWTWARRGRSGPGCRSSSRCGRRGGSADQAAVRAVHARLLASRDWGLAHLDLLADQAWATTGIARAGLPRLSRRPGLCASPTGTSPD